MSKQFDISVVIAVYNTQDYVEESIECILKQSLGFEEHIQLILINDASTDGSGAICEKYAKRYAENIVYVSLEKNGGLSNARNLGAGLAEGRYVNFFDSDDLWSQNALEEAVGYLDAHREEIDLVSSNEMLMEALTGPHILNIPCEKNQIIDIDKDFTKIRSRIASTVLKTELAKGKEFDRKQKGYEDTRYLAELLCDKKKYGMLANTTYYFRKRKKGTSLTQTANQNIDQYILDMELFFRGIYASCMEKNEFFLPWLQVLTAYVLAYRFNENPEMSKIQSDYYARVVKEMLDSVEDRYMVLAPNANKPIKVAMLSAKYEKDIRPQLRLENESLVYNHTKICGLKDNVLSLWSCKKREQNILLEGRISLDVGSEFELKVVPAKEEPRKCTILEYFGGTTKYSMGREVWNLRGFVAEVPVQTDSVKFVVDLDGETHEIPIAIMEYCSKEHQGVYNEIYMKELIS